MNPAGRPLLPGPGGDGHPLPPGQDGLAPARGVALGLLLSLPLWLAMAFVRTARR